MFEGVFTALITPFNQQGVDEKSLVKLIEQQVVAGVAGIVPTGTTGESATLTVAEQLRVIEICVTETKGTAVQVMAGTGANNTAEAIELTSKAEQLGADSTLQVCPYYNKPSQRGLLAHFKAIANACDIPVVLYSIPGRSVIEIAIDTVSQLEQEVSNIVAIKEAGGDPTRVTAIQEVTSANFEVLCGDDPLVLEFMRAGATGLISVASNIIPQIMQQIVAKQIANETVEAIAMREKYLPLLTELMAIDTNPVGIKAAVAAMGYCQADLRLPLVALDNKQSASIEQLLTQFNLI